MSTKSLLKTTCLDPQISSDKAWSVWHYLALWSAFSMNLPLLLSSVHILHLGFNWWQLILIVFSGHALVAMLFALNGSSGAQLGVPFVVVLKSSFGNCGSILVAVLRGLFASVIFGLQLVSLAQLVMAMTFTWKVPGVESLPLLFANTPIAIPAAVAIPLGVLWAVSLLLGLLGVQRLMLVVVPLQLVVGFVTALVVLIWGGVSLNSLGPLLQCPPFQSSVVGPQLPASVAELVQLIAGAIFSVFGFWFIYALSIADYTRYARSNKHQAVGQLVAIPLLSTLTTVVGLFFMSYLSQMAKVLDLAQVEQLTLENFYSPSASSVDPVAASFITVILVGCCLVANVLLNLVTASLCFASLSPRRLGFRGGCVIASLVALFCCPWWLVQTSTGAWIDIVTVGFSGLMGIMLVDWFLAPGSEGVDRLEGEITAYPLGLNPCAFIAWLASLAANVPGVLGILGVLSHPVFAYLFRYASLIALVVAAFMYYPLMRCFHRPERLEFDLGRSSGGPFMLEVGSPIKPEDSISVVGEKRQLD